MARQGVPVCDHAGPVPQRARLTGMRDFGKTVAEARAVFATVSSFESAGAVMLELTLLAAPDTAMITQATTHSTVSIGWGPGADVQYLSGCDILGEPGEKPRHARAWEDFASECARLQTRRTAAFAALRTEAQTGAFPARGECVTTPEEAVQEFSDWLAQLGRPS